jgi:hypothetical protein
MHARSVTHSLSDTYCTMAKDNLTNKIVCVYYMNTLNSLTHSQTCTAQWLTCKMRFCVLHYIIHYYIMELGTIWQVMQGCTYLTRSTQCFIAIVTYSEWATNWA